MTLVFWGGTERINQEPGPSMESEGEHSAPTARPIIESKTTKVYAEVSLEDGKSRHTWLPKLRLT